MRWRSHHAAMICLAALLASCAVAPMKDDAYDVMLESQRRAIDALPSCCPHWRDVDFSQPLSRDGILIDLGKDGTQVRDLGTHRAPVIGLRIDGSASRSESSLEVFSYSHEMAGAMRLDNRLFIRPDVLFLDNNGNVLSEVRNPNMCFGRLGKGGGVWTRIPVAPANVTNVVVIPSIAAPQQVVDTRQLGPVAPGMQTIADARGQTYLASVRFGYTGLIFLRLVGADTPPLGRCVDSAG